MIKKNKKSTKSSFLLNHKIAVNVSGHQMSLFKLWMKGEDGTRLSAVFIQCEQVLTCFTVPFPGNIAYLGKLGT